MGAGTSPAECEFFFGKPCDLSATSQQPIITKFGHETHFGVPSQNPERHFRKCSPFTCPQNLKLKIGQTGTSLRAGHRMHCRDIFFTPLVVQGPGSFRNPANFSVRRTVAELRGFKVAQFSDFGLFSQYKTPKTYLPVTRLQPRGYITECYRFFHVVDKGPKGCLPGTEFSCDFW